MYLVWLHGHSTSSWPGSSGAPTECRAGTNSASVAHRGQHVRPHTGHDLHGDDDVLESVICTPNIGCGALSGPMQNGITYMVRPRMHPRYSSVMVRFISTGSTQLLVGPASAGSAEQMNVRSSTRATSVGSVRAQKEFGRRLRIERHEFARRHQLTGEPVPLGPGPVAPDDPVGSGELGDLGHPAEQSRVGGGSPFKSCGGGHGGHDSLLVVDVDLGISQSSPDEGG